MISESYECHPERLGRIIGPLAGVLYPQAAGWVPTIGSYAASVEARGEHGGHACGVLDALLDHERIGALGYTLGIVQAEKIIEEALKLDPVERERVAHELLESIGDTAGVDLSPEWEAEVQRRLRDMDAGRVEMIPAEKVFAELEAELRSRRASK